MPRLRLERLAVHAFCLGCLGFDHLQLVYQPLEWVEALQDRWFVVEGVRDGALLGVQGADGALSLARANAATGDALVQRIGTPQSRGSVIVAEGPDVGLAWLSMSRLAADIEQQALPYIAYAAPPSWLPTINSNSLVASLLHHAGYDITRHLPTGTRLIPGIETRIGTSSPDTMRAGGHVSSLLGGDADDLLMDGDATLSGQSAAKLYGGSGDDTCWLLRPDSLCHGGEPGLPKALDGRDLALVASGRGPYTLTAPAAADDARPDLIIATPDGSLRLTSVEAVRWQAQSDTVRIGADVLSRHAALSLDLGEHGTDVRDTLDLRGAAHGLIVTADVDNEMHVTARAAATGTLRVRSAEVIVASSASDLLWFGARVTRVDAGGGDDIVVASGPDLDMTVAPGAGADVIVMDLTTPTIANVVAKLDIDGADASDRLLLIRARYGCDGTDPIVDTLLGPGHGETDGVHYRRDGAALRIDVQDSRRSGLIAILRLNNFREGDAGISTRQRNQPTAAAVDLSVAISDCRPSRLWQTTLAERTGSAIASMQQIARYQIVPCGACDGDANSAIDPDDDRMRGRPWRGRGRVTATRAGALHFAGWPVVHRCESRGRGDADPRRRYGVAARRRARAVPPSLPRVGRRLAAARRGPRDARAACAGQAHRTSLLGPPQRSLGTSSGPCLCRTPRSARMGPGGYAARGTRAGFRAARSDRVP